MQLPQTQRLVSEPLMEKATTDRQVLTTVAVDSPRSERRNDSKSHKTNAAGCTSTACAAGAMWPRSRKILQKLLGRGGIAARPRLADDGWPGTASADARPEPSDKLAPLEPAAEVGEQITLGVDRVRRISRLRELRRKALDAALQRPWAGRSPLGQLQLRAGWSPSFASSKIRE